MFQETKLYVSHPLNTTLWGNILVSLPVLNMALLTWVRL